MVRNLPKTVTNISIILKILTVEFFLACSNMKEVKIIDCWMHPTGIISIVVENCHDLQMDTLDISFCDEFDDIQLSTEHIDMLSSNYYVSYGDPLTPNCIIFERIRARC